MLVISFVYSLYFGNLYFIWYIVDIALCISRLLLYNNFKRGVMSQVKLMFRVSFILTERFELEIRSEKDR